MASKKKLLQAAAGSAGGAALDIPDVFSTYLYTGTGSAQTITNGIDLSGEGGLTWIKGRMAGGFSHYLFDTERGVTKYIRSNETNEEGTDSNTLTAFNSNGFSVGSANATNYNTGDFVSWTFRKAPKFFDVVTYTGNGTSGRTVSHNLGTTVGTLIVKRTDNGANWKVFHRSLANTANLTLNSTADAGASSSFFNDTAPTSSVFTVGNSNDVNGNGATYVAYLFAHNNNDGTFGPDSDQDIIKCGSFEVTTGSTTVNVGFEPQFILHKRTNASGNWVLWDTMRGYAAPDGDSNGAGGDAKYLYANLTNSEATTNHGGLTSNGFVFPSNFAPGTDPGDTYIYMAIRRGPLAAPEDATKVFDVFNTTNTGGASTIGSMGPSDLILNKRTDAAATWRILDRLRGGTMLRTDSTDSESSDGFLEWDTMTGVNVTSSGAPYITNDSQTHWSWKRAPSYFDVVAYKSTTSAQTLNHNLSAIPEMMWIKNRDDTKDWQVYHSALGNTKYLQLNTTDAEATASNRWNNTSPTATQFTVGTAQKVNDVTATRNYIAYLFATVAGVSKVGSFVSDGNPQNIDCGFSSGARFVLIKKSSGTFNWRVWDSVRGIVAGDDPYIFLDTDGASTTNGDWIDPHSSGFSITTAFSNGTYIFYAIA